MNIEDLTQLSFEQLDEIQRRVSTAINEKKMMRVGDSASEILDLLASNYADIDLWDVLNELAFRSEIKLNLKRNLVDYGVPLEMSGEVQLSGTSEPPACNIELLLERLKTIRNAVLQHDDSRLLWLTNGATQKTSKLFGKDLAEVLQEAIKRLERLQDVEGEDKKNENLNAEIIKVDEWAEFKLGISLLYGTLTVINPFSCRENQAKENPRISQRAPVSEISKAKANLELSFVSNQRRSTNGYAR
ncbi:hypothetical protein [Leptolyngbya sp. KIOST-1]|uniref:hypothetical protein n=1 Tax=Leptolyngbya sp. KIOST-1 TaxID=1229172 RepID=UPI000564D46F|nr:hypothetical protein [Leptolyngbya sp. KIOST-1]